MLLILLLVFLLDFMNFAIDIVIHKRFTVLKFPVVLVSVTIFFFLLINLQCKIYIVQINYEINSDNKDKIL